jgi:hypothetical protein
MLRRAAKEKIAKIIDHTTMAMTMTIRPAEQETTMVTRSSPFILPPAGTSGMIESMDMINRGLDTVS